MPVDRAKRDAATEALAAFLRHETGFEALETASDDLKNEIFEGVIAISKDDSILIEVLETVFEYGDRDKPLPEKQWLEMCRYLAFL